MVYKPNIPLPSDNISVSQGDINGNFQSLNTSFGIDHYPFADTSSNAGKHNVVTTPLIGGAVHPVTVADPKFYAMQNTVPLGVLQYSRGPNSAVPTPVTYLQSTAATIVLGPGATTNILDFTGISGFIGSVSAYDSTLVNVSAPSVFWNGSAFQIGASGNLKVQASGNVLQLKNNTAGALNVYWTLLIHRIQ